MADQTERKEKLSYTEILADVVSTSSQSSRNATDGGENRTDINRTSTSIQSGLKNQSSTGENKSERKVDSKNEKAVSSVSYENLGFRITFSIPFTGIIPINSTGQSC